MKKLLQLLLCICFLSYAKAQTAETEPNNVWDQSKVIAIGGTGTGTADISPDEDWWKVVTPGDGQLSVTWASTNGNYIYCEVYDTAGTIRVSQVSYTNSTATYNLDGLAKGTYYIRLYPYNGTQPVTYTVAPTFTAAPVANDAEPDSTAATALTIALNGSTTGHVGYYYKNHRDSADFYKVTTNADGDLAATINSNNGQYVYLQVLDGDGTTVFTSNYTNTTLTLTVAGLLPGIYYLKVFPYDGVGGFIPYTLSNTLTTPLTGNDTEPNATPALAKPFTLNGSVNGHVGYYYNHTRDSSDYFKLITNADGDLSVNITSNNGQYVYLQIIDGDGTTTFVSNYTNTTLTLTVNGLLPGAYYVKVFPYDPVGGFIPYTLTNSLALPATAIDPEPNNTAALASLFVLNGSVTGHNNYYYNGYRDTSDYFKVTTNVDGDLAVTLNITTGNGRYAYLQIIDGDGATVLASNYTQSTLTLTVPGLLPGTYYAKVFAYSVASDWITYTLSNTLTPASLANDNEPNNSIATAQVFNPNSTLTGHVGYYYNGYRDSLDIFSLTTTGDGSINLNINSNNGQYIYVQLYDHDGSTVLASVYTQSNTDLFTNRLAAGTYYVKVFAYSVTTGYIPYTLTNTADYMNFAHEAPANNDIAAQGTILPANTNKTGTIYYYYNLINDNIDWWKIGYDGSTGTMALHIDEEQNHANTDFPYITYSLYLDTLAAPISSGQLHAATNTINLTGLAVGIYYLRLDPTFSTFGAYQLNATYTEKCANVVSIGSSSQSAGCNGNISYNITGGLAPYTVQLYKDGVANGAPQTSVTGAISFTNLGLGSYYARSYSFGGSGQCNNISSSTVFAAPATPTISTGGGATTFCQGGSVTLTSTAASTYLWSNGATTQAITVTTGGSYSVTAYNAAGCPSAVSATTVVTVNALPATPTVQAGAATTFCAGGSVTLTSSAATSYLWSNGATTQAITVSANGTFTVVVKNANGCSSATSAATVVTVNPLPATPTIGAGSATTFCAPGNVTLTSSAATSYLWSNGATTQAITVSANGTFTVVVKNANGCSSATSAATIVTVNPLPTVTQSAFTTVCSTDAAFALSGGSPAGGTYSGTGVNSGQFNPATAGVGSFPITYSYTNANGCTNTAIQSIIVNNCTAPCNASASAGGPTTFCAGGNVTLTASAGASYLWSNGATSASITVSTGGSYSVAVTNANNCTATSNTIVVTVNTLPSTPTISTGGAATTFCTGGSVTLTSSSATNNVWSTGATTQSINVNGSGSYTVVVSNANGCSATSAATVVTVNPLPTVTLGQFATKCSTDAAFVLSGGTPAGGTYSGTGVSGGQFNPATAGVGTFTITYSYTNANNCSASATQSITVNNCTAPCTATASAGGPTTFCAGSNVVLTASAGVSYLWSNGATSASITVSAAGNYSVAVTNANNCTATSNVIAVAVNPLPTVTLAAFTAKCSTDVAFTLTGGSPAGGTYSGTGVSGGQFNPATAGVGTFAITYSYSNANGCSATAVQNITVNNCTTVCASTITANGATTFCSGGSVKLIASAGASYLWSNGATASNITVTSGGSYTVKVTQSNGCFATSAATVVTVNALPSIPTITAGSATTFCSPGSVTLTSSAATSYLWSNGATTQSITVTASGNYSVTVKNTSGCAKTSAATTVTANNCGGTYCTASSTSKNKGYINNMKFRTINNTSGWNGGYGNFTNLTAAVNRMTCYTISVTPGYVGCSTTPLYSRVWIDWNHDGDFNDAGELVFAPSGASTGTRNGSVSVPCNAWCGTTRMRVEMRSDCNPSACGSFTYGEVEDYTINVSCSSSRGIEIADDIVLSESFTVYPNPVADEMLIRRSSNDNSIIVDANATLILTDLNGRIVLQSQIKKSTEEIDVRKLPSGIYVVQIKTNNGTTTQKVVVSH